MFPRRSSIFVLLAGLLAAFSVAPQEPPPPPSVPAPIAEPEPFRQWLDEVRAQRHAREARRRADKEARNARRRWIDPWGAALQEAREQESLRRRQELIEHVERDREEFRKRVPWRFRPNPWQERADRSPAETPPPEDAEAASAIPPGEPHASSYPLPGWDNLWYYRGF